MECEVGEDLFSEVEQFRRAVDGLQGSKDTSILRDRLIRGKEFAIFEDAIHGVREFVHHVLGDVVSYDEIDEIVFALVLRVEAVSFV